MAKLLLINSKTIREGHNKMGDIVAIMDDDYVQNNGDSNFDIKYIKGKPEEVRDNLREIIPSGVSSELSKEVELQNLDRVSKYTFRVSDDTKISVSDMCVCNYSVKTTSEDDTKIQSV